MRDFSHVCIGLSHLKLNSYNFKDLPLLFQTEINLVTSCTFPKPLHNLVYSYTFSVGPISFLHSLCLDQFLSYTLSVGPISFLHSLCWIKFFLTFSLLDQFLSYTLSVGPISFLHSFCWTNFFLTLSLLDQFLSFKS